MEMIHCTSTMQVLVYKVPLMEDLSAVTASFTEVHYRVDRCYFYNSPPDRMCKFHNFQEHAVIVC